MAIEKKWLINLKGKDYPVWAGILDDATRKGLKSLTTTIVQVPSDANGQMAVVMARAEFEDGRVFEDVGDCSPKSTSPQLAAASLRIASTRAKGRVLRDAVNVGDTMYEELPDAEQAEAEEKASPQRLQPNDPEVHDYPCCVCACDVEWEVVGKSRRKFNGKVYCARCAAQLLEGMKAQPSSLTCTEPDCGQIVTEKTASASIQGKGRIICVDCMKKQKAAETVAA